VASGDICMCADRRTGVVGTTIRELATKSPASAAARFEDARCIGRGRLVKATRPFAPKVRGGTEIVVWSDMVKETARTQARRLLNLKRRQIADKSRISRGQVRE